MRDVISGCTCFISVLLKFDKKLFYRLCFTNLFCTFIVTPMCYCAIGCQHSTFNRLFSCVFLVWRHRLWKVNKSSVRTFRRFFLQFSYLWCSSIIDWIILKTYDQKFTLTTKKSLHIIFKEHYSFTTILLHHTNYANTTKTTHCKQ